MSGRPLALDLFGSPTCIVSGSPMFRGPGGEWCCGVAEPRANAPDAVVGPYVHGKCWAAIR